MAADKNLARGLSVNFVRLTFEVMKALPRSGFDLDATVAQIRNRIWGQDMTEQQKRDQLFGDAPWDELAMAVLDARYLALPDDQLPGTRSELLALCRRLLSRSGDDDLAMRFVAGWSGNIPPATALEQFADDLWDMRLHDADFSNAVVSGRHAAALSSITERAIHHDIGDVAAIRALARMALIWAAFDCQATTARVRRSMTSPFGWLIRGTARRMKAASIATVFRPFFEMVEKFSTMYRAAGDQDAELARPRIRLPEVLDIRSRTKLLAGAIEAADGEFAIDEAMLAARSRLEQSGNVLIDQLRKEKTDHSFGRRHMSEIWYGLLPLQAVRLAAMRLVQMEQTLEPLLQGAVDLARSQSSPVVVLIPDFDATDLEAGWKRRVRAIVDTLRGAVLRDDDHHSVRKARRVAANGDVDAWQGAPNDDSYTDGVAAWFARTGRYGPISDRAAWAERRMALDLLDTAIGRRFRAIGTTLGTIAPIV